MLHVQASKRTGRPRGLCPREAKGGGRGHRNSRRAADCPALWGSSPSAVWLTHPEPAGPVHGYGLPAAIMVCVPTATAQMSWTSPEVRHTHKALAGDPSRFGGGGFRVNKLV